MSYRMVPPPRERRSPLLLMVLLALVPAAGLAYAWRWADAKIPATSPVTDAKDAVVSNTGEPASDDPPVPVVALVTPVLSVRRAPATLSRVSSEAALVNALTLLSGYVGDGSCLVVSLGARVVFDHNGNLPVTPASNQKLLVAAVALEVLSPVYTFTTSMRGTVADGVVTGDLYLVGGGDPLLSTGDYPPTQEFPPVDTTSAEALVANLVAAGVTRVQGNVIADDSRYDVERYVPSWSADVRDIEAGPLGALMINDAVRKVGAGSTARQPDPAVGAATEVIRLMKAAGITVRGGARPGLAPPEATDITSVQSAPLAAVVAEMLSTSDDNTAELLLKEIGVATHTGNSRQAGIDVVLTTLAAWGIDTTGLNLVDGSGLDLGDTVTCNVVRQVLVHQPLDGPLGAGLAIAGQSGTLAGDTTLGPAMTGRLHAKTGTLTNTKALSGYVDTDAGTIEFSLILDFANASQSYPGIWGALGDAFSKYPGGATIEQLQPR